MRALILALFLINIAWTAPDQINGEYYTCSIMDNISMCNISNDRNLATLVSMIALDNMQYMTDNAILLDVHIRISSGTVLTLKGVDMVECMYGSEDHNEFKECVTDIVEVRKEA